MYNSNIDVRLAHEVRLVDAPNGGGFLEIETASKTYALRSEDSAVLHAWRRELYELLPYLHVTEVKCGWLYKRGETANASFKRRFCMLFSSYRLLYFESEACTKRKGAVDLSVAESVVARRSSAAKDEYFTASRFSNSLIIPPTIDRDHNGIQTKVGVGGSFSDHSRP